MVVATVGVEAALPPSPWVIGNTDMGLGDPLGGVLTGMTSDGQGTIWMSLASTNSPDPPLLTYDAVAQRWGDIPLPPAPADSSNGVQAAFNSGAKMFLVADSLYVLWNNTIAFAFYRYRPASNTWTPLSTSGRPSAALVAGAASSSTQILLTFNIYDATKAPPYTTAAALYTIASDSWAPFPVPAQMNGQQQQTLPVFSVGDRWLAYQPSDLGSKALLRFDEGAHQWTPVSTTDAPGPTESIASLVPTSAGLVVPTLSGTRATGAAGNWYAYDAVLDTWTRTPMSYTTRTHWPGGSAPGVTCTSGGRMVFCFGAGNAFGAAFDTVTRLDQLVPNPGLGAQNISASAAVGGGAITCNGDGACALLTMPPGCGPVLAASSPDASAPDAGIACRSTETTCGGLCFDTSHDPNNCGGCLNRCTSGSCSNGVCTPTDGGGI